MPWTSSEDMIVKYFLEGCEKKVSPKKSPKTIDKILCESQIFKNSKILTFPCLESKRCVVWLWFFHWRIELRSEHHSDTLKSVSRCVVNILEAVERKCSPNSDLRQKCRNMLSESNFWKFKNFHFCFQLFLKYFLRTFKHHSRYRSGSPNVALYASEKFIAIPHILGF